VLDEPTTAMDGETRQAFRTVMNAEVAESRVLLFATRQVGMDLIRGGTMSVTSAGAS
jgi:ABC-type transport system involved in cytochrome c biogenesis ATPase subunit